MSAPHLDSDVINSGQSRRQKWKAWTKCNSAQAMCCIVGNGRGLMNGSTGRCTGGKSHGSCENADDLCECLSASLPERSVGGRQRERRYLAPLLSRLPGDRHELRRPGGCVYAGCHVT